MVADDPLGSDAPARLPTVSLAKDEPLVSEMLAAVDVLDRETTVVLRTVMTSASTLLVECDAIGAATPPGWAWLDLDAQAIARLEPETSRAAVAAWVRERTDGWS